MPPLDKAHQLERRARAIVESLQGRSGAGFSLSLEEGVAIGINKADGGLEVSGVEADPVALVPWHSIPMRLSFLSVLVMSFRALAD